MMPPFPSLSCPYAPECVEDEFSEVELPLYGVLGSSRRASPDGINLLEWNTTRHPKPYVRQLLHQRATLLRRASSAGTDRQCALR
jgi:hypothetical protein